MSLITNHIPFIQNDLRIALATQDQAPEITDIINHAFWPSHKVFLDENNPLSRERVTEEFIRTAIDANDKELYILFDAVNSLIVGTILLQKNVENEPNTSKFNLLTRNPDFRFYNGPNVGDLLINHVINRVMELGKSILKIEVVDSGGDSNKLITYYEKRGFIKTGKILDFPRKHCLKPNYIDKVRLVELQHVFTKPKL